MNVVLKSALFFCLILAASESANLKTRSFQRLSVLRGGRPLKASKMKDAGSNQLVREEATKNSKSQHYIDPQILEKLDQVKDLKDFVKAFKPKGFEIKKEKIPVPTFIGNPPVGPAGVSGGSIPGAPGLQGPLGSLLPDDVNQVQMQEQETVYFQNQVVVDLPQTVETCTPKNSTKTLMEIGVAYWPACVALMKCGGCCSSGKECVAMTTAAKTFSLLQLKGYSIAPVRKVLKEDVTCMCDCIVKASDCFPKQTYSKQRCQCECLNTNTTCSSDRKWSPTECDCKCKNRVECPSCLQKWNEKTCSCDCTDVLCPPGLTRDQQSCVCS